MSVLNKEEINQSKKNRYKIFNWVGTYFSFINVGMTKVGDSYNNILMIKMDE